MNIHQRKLAIDFTKGTGDVLLTVEFSQTNRDKVITRCLDSKHSVQSMIPVIVNTGK